MIQHFYHLCLVVGVSCAALSEVPNGCLPPHAVDYPDYRLVNTSHPFNTHSGAIQHRKKSDELNLHREDFIGTAEK